MTNEDILRKNLVELLTKSHAHMVFEDAVKDFPMNKINTHFTNESYSPWALLEHIRITQMDILDFIKNKNYKYIKWPDEYWPKKNKVATPTDWKKTINGFKKDLNELVKIVKNKKTNLYATIPWGEGQTILREIITVGDHNAYHIGEFAIMRQAMGTWSKKR